VAVAAGRQRGAIVCRQVDDVGGGPDDWRQRQMIAAAAGPGRARTGQKAVRLRWRGILGH
jgi:hypothetical protein